MQGEPDAGLLGDGHDPAQEVREVLPECGLGREIGLGSRRRGDHRGVVVLGRQRATALRHREAGAGPAVDRHPVVTERRDPDRPHRTDLLAERVELLLATRHAEPDAIERRRVLDRRQLDPAASYRSCRRRIAFRLQLCSPAATPRSSRSSRCDSSLRSQRARCSPAASRLTAWRTPS